MHKLNYRFICRYIAYLFLRILCSFLLLNRYLLVSAFFTHTSTLHTLRSLCSEHLHYTHFNLHTYAHTVVDKSKAGIVMSVGIVWKVNPDLFLLNPFGTVVPMTNVLHSFVHYKHATTSDEKSFLQDILVILKWIFQSY